MRRRRPARTCCARVARPRAGMHRPIDRFIRTLVGRRRAMSAGRVHTCMLPPSETRPTAVGTIPLEFDSIGNICTKISARTELGLVRTTNRPNPTDYRRGISLSAAAKSGPPWRATTRLCTCASASHRDRVSSPQGTCPLAPELHAHANSHGKKIY